MAEPFEIGEPIKLGRRQPEPISQGPRRFNGGKVPCPRRRDRLHTMRFEAPLRDGDFIAVFGARAGEPGVRQQELRHMAAAGPCSAVEGLNESAREGSKPTPAAP